MSDDTLVLARGTKVAVVDPTGRVLSRPAIAPDIVQNAAMDHRVIAWIAGANDDEIHLLDLNTGTERWSASTAHRAVSILLGGSSVGALTVEGVELHHLADGALGYHRTGPKVVDADYRDGTFVFIDDDGLIEAVDESRDTQRWTFDAKASHLGEHDYVHIENGNVLALDWQFDLATGASRPRAETKRKPPGVTTNDIARTNERTTLSIEDPAALHPKMDLLDRRGGVVWRSGEWERFLLPYGLTGTAITQSGDGVVVLELDDRDLMKSNDRFPRLVGFDSKTGHVRYDRRVGVNDELVGRDDVCAGFLAEGSAAALQCLDAKTGAVRWEHAGGTYARAWHIKQQWIVASGSPAKLEALDSTGKVLWTTTLPDTQVAETSSTGLLSHAGTPSEAMWELGPAYFVLRGAHEISILDLTTGKLATVTP